jgi:hypothetical protein
MAKLQVLDKIALGEFIIKVAQDEGNLRQQVINNPKEFLSKFVEIPPDRQENGTTIKHEIKILEDTQDLTYVVLPWKHNVDRAMDDIDHQTEIYPNEYRPGHPTYINDTKEPRKALFFRFGEYMFSRCKH